MELCGFTTQVHGYTNKYGDRAIVGIDATTSTLEENSISLNEIIEMAREKKVVSRVVNIADCGFGNIGKDGFDVLEITLFPRTRSASYSDENVMIWIPTEGIEGSPSFSLAQQGFFYLFGDRFLRGWADGSFNGRTRWYSHNGRSTSICSTEYCTTRMASQTESSRKRGSPRLIIRDNRIEEAPKLKHLPCCPKI